MLSDEVSAKEELAKALKLQKLIEQKVQQVKLECESIKRRKEILKQGFKHLVTHAAFEHAKKIKREQNKEKNPWLPQSINVKPLFGQHKESELDQKIAEILFEKPDHDKDDLDSQMTVTDHDQDERDF